MPRYQAVFLDAGDTLLDFYGANNRVTDIVYARTGFAINPVAAQPYFDAAFHYALGNRPDGLLWVKDREAEYVYWRNYYAGWLQAAGLGETAERDRLVEELVTDTLTTEIFEAFADVVPTLDALRATGVRLVLISNAFPSMQDIMQHLDLERHFDRCLYSCYVGYEKPHAEIFNMALRAVDLPPAATCFVDDLPRNIEASTSMGIQGFLLDRWDRHPHSPLPKIAGLADLLPQLGI